LFAALRGAGSGGGGGALAFATEVEIKGMEKTHMKDFVSGMAFTLGFFAAYLMAVGGLIAFVGVLA
jgi:hypothetical protein